MKRLSFGFLLGLLAFGSAHAADNGIQVTNGGGPILRSIDVGAGVQSMMHILGSTTGTAIYGTAGTANANVISVQGIASMTPFLSNPGTSTLWGLQTNGSTIPSVSMAQGIAVGGATRPATGASLGSTYSQHIAVVDGSGNQITSFGGSNASVSATASAVPASATYMGLNVSGNLVGVSSSNPVPVSSGVTAGTTTSGQTMSPIGCSVTTSAPTYTTAQLNFVNCNTSGEARVALSSLPTFPSGNNIIGYVNNDPCARLTKSSVAISQAASAQIIALSGSLKTYICSVVLFSSADEIISIVGGTGSVCATSMAAIMGSTTVANGLSVPAKGGMAVSGGASIAIDNVGAVNICLLQNSTARVSGVITYAQN